MPPTDENAIVYGSDLIVRDPAELTALCLFYDKIRLPYSRREQIWTSDPPPEESVFGKMLESYEPIQAWENEHTLLFTEGVLERLNRQTFPNLSREEPDTWGNEQWASILRAQKKLGPTESLIGVAFDLGIHLCRSDLKVPQIHSEQSDDLIPREVFKAALAQSTFSYLLPVTTALEPDEILSVREKIKDNREGFSMHLQKLSAMVEGRVDAGDSHEDIATYAQSVIETELIPDYKVFLRQLQAHDKARTANKVLAPLRKVLEIESPVTSIKFWAELAKTLGFDVLKGIADDESYTNKNQALQFMRKVDKRDD